MPKTRKSRSNRSQAAANLTGPGSPACSAGNLTINYTAMPTETLRFMLSQRDLNQTGPRRVLITRLQESDSPTTTTAPQVPEQLSAMIASIVEAKLANLTSRSSSGPAVPPEIEPAQASATQPTPTGAPSLVPVHEPSVVPTPPLTRPFNGQDKTRWIGRTRCIGPRQSGRCRLYPPKLQASVGGQPPFQQPDSGHHKR